MPAAEPSVSVVTIVRDRRDHLANLARGLRRCRPRPEELVVVDMGSVADPAPLLAATLDGTVPWRTVPIGLVGGALPLAAARNLGAATATGEVLVFLDVDCIPAPDLVGAYRWADAGAIACGPVRYLIEGWADRVPQPSPHGAPQPSPDGAPLPSLDVAALWAASAAHPARPAPAHDRLDDRHELFWSLSFGLHRATWERIGGFDPSFVGYGAEDTDLAFTARARGVRVQWLAAGVAFHQWHASTAPPVEHLRTIVANARRFRDKWGCWPMEGWLAAFADAGLVRWQPDGDDLEELRAA